MRNQHKDEPRLNATNIREQEESQNHPRRSILGSPFSGSQNSLGKDMLHKEITNEVSAAGHTNSNKNQSEMINVDD